MTTYVVTVHFRTPKFIDLQVPRRASYLPKDSITVASLEDVPDFWGGRFDVAFLDLRGRHSGKLNFLASWCCDNAKSDDDVILFLDGDAFPVADLSGLVEEVRRSDRLHAVQRLECVGDLQPHPCFALATVGLWKRIRGDWSQGYSWINRDGTRVSDVGGNLLGLLEAANEPWTPIRRSIVHRRHAVFFGTYGDVVYHHGSGFRMGTTRWDRDEAFPLKEWVRIPVVGYFVRAIRRLWLKWRARTLNILSHRILEEAGRRADFYRRIDEIA